MTGFFLSQLAIPGASANPFRTAIVRVEATVPVVPRAGSTVVPGGEGGSLVELKGGSCLGQRSGSRRTVQRREPNRFAALPNGHETPEGFLALDPVEPMRVMPTDAPDALLTAGDEVPVGSLLRGRTCPDDGPVTSNGYTLALGQEPEIVVLCSPAHSIEIVIWRTRLTDAELDSVRLEVGVTEPTGEVPAVSPEQGFVYPPSGRKPAAGRMGLDIDPPRNRSGSRQRYYPQTAHHRPTAPGRSP